MESRSAHNKYVLLQLITFICNIKKTKHNLVENGITPPPPPTPPPPTGLCVGTHYYF